MTLLGQNHNHGEDESIMGMVVVMVVVMIMMNDAARVFHSGSYVHPHCCCDSINDGDHPPLYLVNDDFAMLIISITYFFPSHDFEDFAMLIILHHQSVSLWKLGGSSSSSLPSC